MDSSRKKTKKMSLREKIVDKIPVVLLVFFLLFISISTALFLKRIADGPVHVSDQQNYIELNKENVDAYIQKSQKEQDIADAKRTVSGVWWILIDFLIKVGRYSPCHERMQMSGRMGIPYRRIRSPSFLALAFRISSKHWSQCDQKLRIKIKRVKNE